MSTDEVGAGAGAGGGGTGNEPRAGGGIVSGTADAAHANPPAATTPTSSGSPASAALDGRADGQPDQQPVLVGLGEGGRAVRGDPRRRTAVQQHQLAGSVRAEGREHVRRAVPLVVGEQRPDPLDGRPGQGGAGEEHGPAPRDQRAGSRHVVDPHRRSALSARPC